MRKYLPIVALALLSLSACSRKPSYREAFEKYFDENVGACAQSLISAGEDSALAIKQCSCMLRGLYDIDSTFILMNPQEQQAFIAKHIDALYKAMESVVSTVRYTVASRQGDCVGVAPQKCMLIKKGDAADWEFFYSSIEGFQYEPGYEYILEVREEKLDNVPVDASSIKYTLVRELSKVQKESENLPVSEEEIIYPTNRIGNNNSGND